MKFAENAGALRKSESEGRPGPCRRALRALGERYGRKIAALGLIGAASGGAACFPDASDCNYRYTLEQCLTMKNAIPLDPANNSVHLGDVKLFMGGTCKEGPGALIELSTTAYRECSVNDEPPPRKYVQLAKGKVLLGKASVIGIEDREYTITAQDVGFGIVAEAGWTNLTVEVACRKGLSPPQERAVKSDEIADPLSSPTACKEGAMGQAK